MLRASYLQLCQGGPKTGKRINKGGMLEWCCFRGLPHKGLAWPVALKFY